MGTEPPTIDVPGVDLTDDSYTVEQSFIRNKYRAEDANGNTVLRGKQKLFKLKEEFPFVDGQGNDAFTVKAGGIVDVAGNYVITDAATGREVVVLDNDFSIFQDTWHIRDGETGRKLAEINSRGALVTLARAYVPIVGPLIPHKYEITDADGRHVGRIDGQLSLRDRYRIVIDDASTVPREAIVAAAMVIDAIQGN
ncbi:MAG: hypothetical protein BRD23_03880 [Halobacteriales archaeon SW_9_67_25]|jgi:uncharacterized protein YxjI|nr:MAG: hypothetical protein BRD23_03880 [Halobacteriales archaeon SW_9_67_25]